MARVHRGRETPRGDDDPGRAQRRAGEPRAAVRPRDAALLDRPHEVIVRRNGRKFAEIREERRDTFTTDDVEKYRREWLASHLSPGTAQKVLVLLHAVLKLAKRRKLITTNPSEDAERITLDGPGVFNVLAPIEFEAVYRAVLGQQGDAAGEDEITKLTDAERELYGALLSTAFYAGPRLGELRDVPWRNVDFAGSMIRIESGYTSGGRSTPKGKRARSTPMAPIPAQRLASLSTRERFTGAADYVFSTELGERIGDSRIRKLFSAALVRAGLGHRRDDVDQRGNPQGADPGPRPPPLLVHLGGQCLAAHEGPGVRRSPRHQDHAAIRAPPDETQAADLGGAYPDAALAHASGVA